MQSDHQFLEKCINRTSFISLVLFCDVLTVNYSVKYKKHVNREYMVGHILMKGNKFKIYNLLEYVAKV